MKDYGGRIEFISVKGDLKEALLWLNDASVRTTATLLTETKTLRWQDDNPPDQSPLSRPLGRLVEPDPALICAGLVQSVARKFNGHLLDETIAYFTTETKPISAWVRAWQIQDWLPFQLKKLRAYLREWQIEHVTVKKRGSPLTPEKLIAQLKLRGDQSCTLVLTPQGGQPIVMICADRIGGDECH